MWTEQHLSFGGRCMYKRERAGFVFQISLGIVERGSFANACVSTSSRLCFVFLFHGRGQWGKEAGVQLIQSTTDTGWKVISKCTRRQHPARAHATGGTAESRAAFLQAHLHARLLKSEIADWLPLLTIARRNYQGHLKAYSRDCCLLSCLFLRLWGFAIVESIPRHSVDSFIFSHQI